MFPLSQHLRALDVGYRASHSVLLAPARPGVQHAIPHHEPPSCHTRARRCGSPVTWLGAETLRDDYIRPRRPLAVADAAREQHGCTTGVWCRARSDPAAAPACCNSGQEQAPAAVSVEQVRAGLIKLLQAAAVLSACGDWRTS